MILNWNWVWDTGVRSRVVSLHPKNEMAIKTAPEQQLNLTTPFDAIFRLRIDDVVHTVRQTQIYAHASFLRRKKGWQIHNFTPFQNLLKTFGSFMRKYILGLLRFFDFVQEEEAGLEFFVCTWMKLMEFDSWVHINSEALECHHFSSPQKDTLCKNDQIVSGKKIRKNSWKFVYILAKKRKTPFNLAIFFLQTQNAVEFTECNFCLWTSFS